MAGSPPAIVFKEAPQSEGFLFSKGFYRGLAGGIAGMCAVTVGQPLDAIKVRLQTTSPKQPHPKVLATVKSMYKKEGFFSFYRGLPAPLFLRFAVTGFFFFVNGFYKDSYIAYRMRKEPDTFDSSAPLPLTTVLLIGGLSGLSLAPMVTPGELVKIQMQADKLSQLKPKYQSTFHCIKEVVKRGGAYRGFGITLCRQFPGCGTYLCIYDWFNRVWEKRATLDENAVLGSWQTSLRVAIGGSLAGTVSWALCYPFDFVKSRVQSQALNRKAYKARDIMSTTYRHAGLRGFCRGMQPCLLRASPVNLSQLWIYECCMSLFHVKHSDDD